MKWCPKMCFPGPDPAIPEHICAVISWMRSFPSQLVAKRLQSPEARLSSSDCWICCMVWAAHVSVLLPLCFPRDEETPQGTPRGHRDPTSALKEGRMQLWWNCALGEETGGCTDTQGWGDTQSPWQRDKWGVWICCASLWHTEDDGCLVLSLHSLIYWLHDPVKTIKI